MTAMEWVRCGFSIVYKGQRHEWGRLQRELAGLSHWLRSQGVTADMRVASRTEDAWSNALLTLCLSRMGCVFMPLDPALPAPHLQRLWQHCAPDLLLEEIPQSFALHTPPRASSVLPSSAPQLLLATSGSTGSGRLIALTGENLRISADAVCQRLGFAQGDCWLACLPLFHIGGLSILHRAARAGASVALLDSFDVAEVLRLLRRDQVTHLSLVPTMLHRLLQQAPGFRPGKRLRVVLLAGSACSADLLQRGLSAGWPLYSGYGLTESAALVSVSRVEPGRDASDVGSALPHVQLKIDNKEGRICVRGGSVAQCAYTERGLVKLLDADGWLVSNDLGDMDAAGNLRILGRRDEVMISGGKKIHPRQVEEILVQCPGVHDLAVIALQDAHWGQRLVACFTGPLSAMKLQAYADQYLRGAYKPKHFLRLDALPVNALGKLQRGRLTDKVRQRLER